VKQLEKDSSDYSEQPAIKDITHRHHAQTHTHLMQKYYWSTEYTFIMISAAENNTCIKISKKMNISIHFPHFLPRFDKKSSTSIFLELYWMKDAIPIQRRSKLGRLLLVHYACLYSNLGKTGPLVNDTCIKIGPKSNFFMHFSHFSFRFRTKIDNSRIPQISLGGRYGSLPSKSTMWDSPVIQ